MEKQTPFSEKLRALLREKGVYVVLFVSLAVVGVAVAAAFWPRPESELPPEGTGQEQALEPVAEQEDERLSEAKSLTLPAETAEATPIPDFTPAPKSSSGSAAPKKLSAPVGGKIIWDYAMDELIYSVTLKQWMTHSGVDIAASKGSEVYAVLGGTVEAVYEDDALGTTVLLSHSDARKTLYANLKEEVPVKEGDRVSAGDCIGYVGASAPAECGLQSHLHFEMHIEGSPVNPAGYVRFES